MVVSNTISLARLVLAIPLAYFVYHESHFLVFILGIVVFISDYADGYFARRFNEVTELGKIIDPVADKVVVIAVALALLATDRTPLWFLVAIAARDILIVIGGITIRRKLKGFTLPSNMVGKLTVNVLAIVFLLQYLNVNGAYTIGSLVGLVFLIISFLSYLGRAREIIKNKNGLKSRH